VLHSTKISKSRTAYLLNKAIVAIARKLLIAVWHVIGERTSDAAAIA
jgi:hypothetical protein